MLIENKESRHGQNPRFETNESKFGGNGNGHIRCLGVVPVAIEDLLREIQSEMDAE